MIRNGFSYVEVLISAMALAVLTLSIADFSSNVFKVSFDHSKQVENAYQTRFSSEIIVSEILKASYIFPANRDFNLSGSGMNDISINTNDSIAMLIPVDPDLDSTKYIFKAFYFVENLSNKYDLYEFTGSSQISWSKNTLPSNSSFSGFSSVVASDVIYDETDLEYVLNYDNGISDSILKGSISSVTPDNSYALIKGVKLSLVLDKKVKNTILIEGISRNVPRFIE